MYRSVSYERGNPLQMGEVEEDQHAGEYPLNNAFALNDHVSINNGTPCTLNPEPSTLNT